MNKVTWILERDVFDKAYFNDMVYHFKKNDIPYHIVRIIPFIHEIEGEVPQIDGPTVIYGSLGIQKLAQKHGWIPGVWANSFLNETSLIAAIGDNALNSDLIVCKFEEVLNKVQWNPFFIKPNTDTKEFAGMVTSKEAFIEWYMKMVASGYLEDTVLTKEVVISKPKNIGCEWRLVMVEGKVADYSIYRQYQKVMPMHECPQDVIDFAENMAQIYNPLPVFVMDICESENGYKVIEANGFNSAGLYKCDVATIIDKITNYVKENHES